MGSKKRYQPIPGNNSFWRRIADNDWNIANAKNFDIRNPAIRYVARLVANTLLARQDERKVKADKLAFLHRGLHMRLGVENPETEPVDNVCIFLHNLIRARTRYAMNRSAVINIGGMLTPLFSHLGVNLEVYDHTTEYLSMDVRYLRNQHFWLAVFEDGSFVHNFRTRGRAFSCKLPIPQFVDITKPENISFDPPRELCFDTPRGGLMGRGSKPVSNQEQYTYQVSNEEIPSDSDHEPAMPSPENTKKGKKRYKLHKFNGKKIKELLAAAVGWKKVADTVAELRADIRQLQEEMQCMRVGR